MKQVISIGNQDFRSLRESGCFYVDKTNFIKEWWDGKDIVTLITRPRRFGKTLNLSMIESFFSNQYEGRSDLFEELSIWKEEKYQRLQGTYPVIFLSFATVKNTNFQDAKESISQLIIDLYAKFNFLQESPALNLEEKKYFTYVCQTMSNAIIQNSLHRLAICLNKYYGKKVIILLDEYDTPLQEAYINGYWDEMVSFIRNLFNATFKTNPFMERGLLTGITRVSKESIFSDLNNLEVVTTTSEKYITSFGFTKEEVNQETLFMFRSMIKDWFKKPSIHYNDFIKALLLDDIDAMNDFMNRIALQTISSFDSGNQPSEKEPERFYHGFVLGFMIDLATQYSITSNRESGFGRYDVVLEPLKPHLDAIIIEFKVYNPKKEKSLQDTVNAALTQIAEKKYDTDLLAKGIPAEKIHHYGFAFRGKEVFIGRN